jgi:hypothetical protein
MPNFRQRNLPSLFAGSWILVTSRSLAEPTKYELVHVSCVAKSGF